MVDYSRRTIILTSLESDEELFMSVAAETTLRDIFVWWSRMVGSYPFLTNRSTGERANNPESLRKALNFAKPGDVLVFTREEHITLPRRKLPEDF